MPSQKYEAFVMAAQLGSFKSTAEKLGYTQAGISYMMNALEEELGTALFVRDRSGVRLTADGKNLLPWIQDVRASEQALQTRIDEIRDAESGNVRVATFASVAIHWMPSIISEFLEEHPKIDFEFSCFENQDQMEEAIWNGMFDCGFITLPAKMNFHTISLMTEPIYVVIACDHPLADGTTFPRRALAKEPYIKIYNDAYTEYDVIFDRYGIEPNTRFVVDNDFAALGMVSKGLGFGLFPRLILEETSFDVARLEPETPIYREMALAVRSLDKASIATKAFLRFTQDWIRKNVS
ncbi:MAG: LysR family transcriptional regulator [Eggerthellaceae bacterium]|nr:LysR family transcriptional regulator [Eggerthellaceae bacterium]